MEETNLSLEKMLSEVLYHKLIECGVATYLDTLKDESLIKLSFFLNKKDGAFVDIEVEVNPDIMACEEKIWLARKKHE